MDELLTHLQTQLPKDKYYSLLFTHRQEIFQAMGRTSNKEVAELLGMSPQKFSTVIQMLRGYEYLLQETFNGDN